MEYPIVHHKIIYAKRKPLSNELLFEILKLEIDEQVKINPKIVFDKIGKSIDNADRSITYPLHFKLK